MVILVAAVLVASEAAAARLSCEARTDLKGRCFTIHGVLAQANGSPGLRIWHTGTKRILGVLGDANQDEDAAVPPILRDHLGPNVRFYADWRLCPLSRERPGWMRFVCIANVHNIVVFGDGDKPLYRLEKRDR